MVEKEDKAIEERINGLEADVEYSGGVGLDPDIVIELNPDPDEL